MTVKRVRVAIICFWLIGASVRWMAADFENGHRLEESFCCHNTFSVIFDFLLHEYPLQTMTSATKTSKQCPPRTTEGRRDSTEQKKNTKRRYVAHYLKLHPKLKNDTKLRDVFCSAKQEGKLPLPPLF